jgi:hypothetical protein
MFVYTLGSFESVPTFAVWGTLFGSMGGAIVFLNNLGGSTHTVGVGIKGHAPFIFIPTMIGPMTHDPMHNFITEYCHVTLWW